MNDIYLGSYTSKANQITNLLFKTNNVDSILDSSPAKKSEIGYCKDVLSDLLKSYIDIKDKIEHNCNESRYTKELCDNLFSINRSATIMLNEIESKNNNGRFRKEIYDAIEDVHMPDKEKNTRLTISNSLDLFTKRYFSQQDANIVSTLETYLHDLKETTSKSIMSLNNPYMEQLKKINIKKEGKTYNNLEDNLEENHNNKNISKNNNNKFIYEGISSIIQDMIKIEKPKTTLEDIAGLEKQKESILLYSKMINYPDIFLKNDALDISGILFYGPPGTGKTMLAKAMANTLNMDFVNIKFSKILSRYLGDSENIISGLFDFLRKKNNKTMIYIDEIDGISMKRSLNKESESSRRIVNTLLMELDGFEKTNKILPVASTNAIDLIDEGILRSGRFTEHIYVPLPNEKAREQIFKLYINKSNYNSMQNGGDGIFKEFNETEYSKLINITEGWNGADIEHLIKLIKKIKASKEVDTKISELVNYSQFIEGVNEFIAKKHNFNLVISVSNPSNVVNHQHRSLV